jgi:hypothetical protein
MSFENTAPPAGGGRDVVQRFGRWDALTVRQETSVTEVVLSWEKKNRYQVHDPLGRVVLFVREVGAGFGEFFGRMFLGPARACRMRVIDAETSLPVLDLRKPFRLFLPEIRVAAPDGAPLGRVVRRFTWLHRSYAVEDHQTGERLELVGPMWKPWTFSVRQGGLEVGVIRKRWRGLGTELMTDADDFGVDLSQVASPSMRGLVFAATMLVDLAHFERSKG